MKARLIEVDTALRSAMRRRHLHMLEGSQCIFAGSVNAEPPFAPMKGMNVAGEATYGAFSFSYSHLNRIAAIGRYCSIADCVAFAATEHPTDRIGTSSFSYDPGYIWRTFAEDVGGDFMVVPLPEGGRYAPIRIGNDVWIGTQAYVRGGVSIGDGAIVGARAVVTRDVPPYAVVVGNPGRVVRYRFEPHVIEAVRASGWWDYSYTDFAGLPVDDPPAFVDALAERVATGAIEPYRPGPFDVEALMTTLSTASQE